MDLILKIRVISALSPLSHAEDRLRGRRGRARGKVVLATYMLEEKGKVSKADCVDSFQISLKKMAKPTLVPRKWLN